MSIVVDLIDVFKKAAKIDHKRPIVQDTNRGELLYNDSQGCYNALIPEFKRSLSTVDSLVMAVEEECKRRENQTGNFMTVVFDVDGGIFYPDDKKRLDRWNYARCLSQQWEHLTEHLNQDMRHLDFIRFLQGLRPSILDYPSIMKEFKKVTFDARTSVTSQPIIEDGQAGSQVSFILDTKNGKTQTQMPAAIMVHLPFVRGSATNYDLTIELDVALDRNEQVVFRPVCPEIETVTEQAINDEFQVFKNSTQDLKDLLVLLDY